jgi:hypothetical protein
MDHLYRGEMDQGFLCIFHFRYAYILYSEEKCAKSRGVAVNAVSTGAMGVNEAAKAFSIPKSTLLRRMKTINLVKKHRLGSDSLLGEIAEKKLATHIKKLQRSGFAPTREEVRVMAYNLAAKLGVKHNFDNVNRAESLE